MNAISVEIDKSDQSVSLVIDGADGGMTINLHLIDAIDLAHSLLDAVLAHKEFPRLPEHNVHPSPGKN